MYRITLVLVAILSGCAAQNVVHQVPIPPSAVAHSIEKSEGAQYLSCDYKSWFVRDEGRTFGADPRFRRERDGVGLASSMHALPAEKKQLAAESFVYALMSSNAYRDPKVPAFQLPDWKVSRIESSSGLAFEEYHRVEEGKTSEIVFAFKGTDGFFDLADAKANFSIWWQPEQYREAQDAVAARLKEERYAGIPIVVTGHSLGGGIALNISLRQSTEQRKIKAYVFNSSPRGFYRPINGSIDVRRVALDEEGEFLKLGRLIWFGKFRNYWPSTYNFLQINGLKKNFNEHSIYRMARALMLVAIGTDAPYPREVFRQNIAHGIKFSDSMDAQYDRDLCNEVLGPGPLQWEPIVKSH